VLVACSREAWEALRGMVDEPTGAGD